MSLDSSAPLNPLMGQCIQGIVVDLRTLNSGHPGDIFEEFFSKMEETVNEVTAADDRRHGIAHLSQWLLREDLIEQVKSQCPEGTRVPSNLHHRALNFTSRFELKYKTAPSISP